jgi:hypothetical protein
MLDRRHHALEHDRYAHAQLMPTIPTHAGNYYVWSQDGSNTADPFKNGFNVSGGGVLSMNDSLCCKRRKSGKRKHPKSFPSPSSSPSSPVCLSSFIRSRSSFLFPMGWSAGVRFAVRASPRCRARACVWIVLASVLPLRCTARKTPHTTVGDRRMRDHSLSTRLGTLDS